MSASMTNGSSPTGTTMVAVTHQLPRQKLPIIPVIPRKLEKKSRATSTTAAASRTAASIIPEPPSSRPIIRPGRSSQDRLEHHVDRGTGGQPTQRPYKLDDTIAVSTTATADTEVDPAADDTANRTTGEEPATADEPFSPTTLDPLSPPFVPQPPPLTTERSEQALLHAFDPETPPFVPESSQTPTETPEATSSSVLESQSPHPVFTTSNSTPESADAISNSSDTNDDAAKPPNPKVLYPLQTPTSWIPCQTTPPEDVIFSLTQQPYHDYEQAAPLHFGSSVHENHKYLRNKTDSRCDYTRASVSHPQSSRSFISASPAQSTYEGYTISGAPHMIHSRTDSLSYRHHPSTTTTMENHPPHNFFQFQHQHFEVIPQFGSHLPITPSATPSNSGSQKQGFSPTAKVEPSTSMDHNGAAKRSGQDRSTKQISPKYKEWCVRTLEILQETNDPSIFPYPLSTHLLNNFNYPAFADCELYISHANNRFDPAVVSLHTLLVAQNEKLLELLHHAEIREDGKKQILLNVYDQYTNPDALKAALKVCYGERPSKNVGYPEELASELEISTTWMENALALAAAGHLLGMIGIAHRGEQIASIVLDWDNLERALSFAMDASIRRVWGSSTSSSSFPSNASELLLSCLYFIISNVSENTRLDFTAKSMSSIDRLPAVPQSQPQSSRSRLSRIKFGDLPNEAVEPFSNHDILASSILFSVPFAHLKFILDRLPSNVNNKITKLVVEERERRRHQVLNTRTGTVQVNENGNQSFVLQERVITLEDDEQGRLGVEQL